MLVTMLMPAGADEFLEHRTVVKGPLDLAATRLNVVANSVGDQPC